jgi:hypothetical protein
MHTCAIVVPVYQPLASAAERLSLDQTLAVLNDYPVYLVGPEKLKPYFEELKLNVSQRLQYKTFADHFFTSVDGYNNLMLSRRFYQAFDQYEYMLIVQTDALVLSNALEYWCAKQYSYIGAPWFNGFTTPTQPLTLNSVGNGGFSLRRIPDFIRVLSRPRVFKNILMQSWPGNWISTIYRYVKDYHSFFYNNTHLNIDVNEDLFWGLFVPARCRFFKVPSAQQAVAFAFEAHPDYLYQLNHQRLPFGCHAWQRYQPSFWQKVIAENNFDLSARLQLVMNQEQTNQ